MIINAYPYGWLAKDLSFDYISGAIERRVASMQRRMIDRIIITVKPDYTYIGVKIRYDSSKVFASGYRPLSEFEITLSNPEDFKAFKSWVKKYVIPHSSTFENFPPVRGRKLWTRYTIEPELAIEI